MSDARRVLVIGGGIGGLSTTLALRRRDAEVDVVEKNPDWDVYGVGIIQPANALRALDALGLAEACVEQGHPIRGDKTWLADGETLLAERPLTRAEQSSLGTCCFRNVGVSLSHVHEHRLDAAARAPGPQARRLA